jgi:16S rRNA (guanine966-N2)-methyltransferase
MPRIIAGSKKKMILKIPSAGTVRPTTDRIKETLFNIITADIYGSVILDLFAGTGQIGLEALSRGADRCVFVEKNSGVFKVLTDNISRTGFDNYKAYNCDSLLFLCKCTDMFDLVYVDPPYNSGLYDKILCALVQSGVLKENAKIIIEHDMSVEINDNYGILDKYREEKYGNTKMTFMMKRADDGEIGLSGKL